MIYFVPTPQRGAREPVPEPEAHPAPWQESPTQVPEPSCCRSRAKPEAKLSQAQLQSFFRISQHLTRSCVLTN